ncbi:MAG: hypothetical protein ABR497_10515 [Kiritimatiellia bacterium]|nr:hypothetical protein [Lentisphaerota bacterium]
MNTTDSITGRRARAGSVLMVVMCLSGVLVMAGMFMVIMTNQAAARTRRMTDSSRALALAEAGVADLVSRLTTNYNQWRDTTLSADFGGGSYSVVTETQSNGNVLVTSEGTLHGVTRTTVVELLGTLQDINDALFSLDGVILAGTHVEFTTAAFSINGNVHANGDITSAQGAQNGDFLSNTVVSAAGAIGNLSVPVGQQQPGSPAQDLPEFNFDSYRQMAIDGGVYYPNSVTLANWNAVPTNGVVYVNGNVTVKNNSSLHGTLVANGSITVENNFAHTSFSSNFPALMATGNITMRNRGTYNGVIYSGGNVEIQNNMTCNGGIISVGYTAIRNNVTMNQPDGYPLWDPDNPEIPPEVVVGGWLR